MPIHLRFVVSLLLYIPYYVKTFTQNYGTIKGIIALFSNREVAKIALIKMEEGSMICTQTVLFYKPCHGARVRITVYLSS